MAQCEQTFVKRTVGIFVSIDLALHDHCIKAMDSAWEYGLPAMLTSCIRAEAITGDFSVYGKTWLLMSSPLK